MLIFAPSNSEDGTVAQLDRASDYGSEGLGFESLQCHKKNPKQRLGFLFAFILLQNNVKAQWEKAVYGSYNFAAIGVSSGVQVFTIKSVNDIATVGIPPFINVFTIKRIKYIAAIGISTAIQVLAIKSVHDVTTVGISTFINVLSIECIEYITTIGVSTRIQMFAIEGVLNITAVGVSTFVQVGLSTHG